MRVSFFSWVLLAVILAAPPPAASREPVAGGPIQIPEAGPPLTLEQRAEIQAQIVSNRAELRSRGLLSSESQVAAVAAVSLEWPMQLAAGETDPDYHGISNFVDRNPAFPDLLLDYECGTRTYDTAAGYNHGGIDYTLWPFWWTKMDDSSVEIIAAAPGVIVYKNDGEFDQSCAANGNLWNAVYVEHSDGTVAWYGHMKNGSVTSKNVGQSVVLGEVLGVVGSSGNSTAPHLHLELQDSLGNVLDTNTGACNANASLWANQRPYYDSAVNKLATHSAPPANSLCYGSEFPNLEDNFYQGQEIYFAAYYHDQRSTQTSTYTVYRPDDSVYDTWMHASPIDFFITLWVFDDTLPISAPTGTWRFEVVFEGQTVEHTFEVLEAQIQVPALSLNALATMCVLFALLGGWLVVPRTYLRP